MVVQDCPQKEFQIAATKGELVQFNSRKASWYSTIDSSIKVSCRRSDVTIISQRMFQFLAAVPDPDIRYDLLINKQKEFLKAVKLTIGDEVVVLVEIGNNKMALKAIIKYVGDLPGMTGYHFGVELLVSTTQPYSRCQQFDRYVDKTHGSVLLY